MKKIRVSLMAILLATFVLEYACSPNNDKGSTDDNSIKEGSVDSTKIPNFDSSHASLSIPHFLAPSI